MTEHENSVVNENSAERIAELEDQVYNLTLYLSAVQKMLPIAFATIEKSFSGIPGYSVEVLNDPD